MSGAPNIAQPPEAQPGLRKRWFAWLMNSMAPHADLKTGDLKRELFKSLVQDPTVHVVCEVGLGTAPNLKYYAGAEHVTRIIGIDFNPAMQGYARHTAEGVPGAATKLEFVLGRAEQLPLADSSVDAVVLTHVLCSVRDQAAALREARRVLRPGGRLVFLEHVAAPASSWTASAQRLLNPAWGLVGDGCQLTHDTMSSVEAAGFSSLDAKRLEVPLSLGVLRPHACGVATK